MIFNLVIIRTKWSFYCFLAPVVALKLVDGRVFQNPFKTIRNAVRNLDAFSIAFIFVCLIQVVAILISSTADRSRAPLEQALTCSLEYYHLKYLLALL